MFAPSLTVTYSLGSLIILLIFSFIISICLFLRVMSKVRLVIATHGSPKGTEPTTIQINNHKMTLHLKSKGYDCLL